MEDKKKETPLGWAVNVLYMMIQASTVLIEDIDQQLQARGTHFRQDKKLAFKNYSRCIEDARRWMERFGLDTSCWDAVKQDPRAYSNVIADANELIRLVMLYVDRAHSEDGYYKIFRFLRELPGNGLFPDWYIGRFQMHHVWVPGKGDRVRTTNHGDGVIDQKFDNGSYVVNLDDGGQVVLKEEHFKLI